MFFFSKESKSEKNKKKISFFVFGGGEGKEGLASVSDERIRILKTKKNIFFLFLGGRGGGVRGG